MLGAGDGRGCGTPKVTTTQSTFVDLIFNEAHPHPRGFLFSSDCIKAMYAVYREVHPPTGIEHCLECHFVDSSQKNLVVAATSVLRVFTLVS